MNSILALVAIAVLVINLPFGFWRAGLKKFTLPWIIAVHAPVPIVYALRLLTDVPLQLFTFVTLFGVYFAGQFLGAKLHQKWQK
ncbi:hypothetical protein MJD09_01235 [bacterium]|nr:hypothetical protein [bacterium]